MTAAPLRQGGASQVEMIDATAKSETLAFCKNPEASGVPEL